VAAILPGGDPFSMFLLMLPQILSYAVGIWLAGAFGEPLLWTREQWAAGGASSPCAHLWRRGVRGVFEVRQEVSRWDVENPRAASFPGANTATMGRTALRRT